MEGWPGRSPQRRDPRLERGAPSQSGPRDTASVPHPDGLGLCPGIPSSSGAGHWERGETAPLMILPPRPLDAAHLAQAVGRRDENQAAQLGEHNMLEEEVP